MIHIDGDRRDERRDIKAARHIDEARQDEEAQGRGGQMSDLIDGSRGPYTEANSPVGGVERNRGRGQQQWISAPPSRPHYG